MYIPFFYVHNHSGLSFGAQETKVPWAKNTFRDGVSLVHTMAPWAVHFKDVSCHFRVAKVLVRNRVVIATISGIHLCRTGRRDLRSTVSKQDRMVKGRRGTYYNANSARSDEPL